MSMVATWIWSKRVLSSPVHFWENILYFGVFDRVACVVYPVFSDVKRLTQQIENWKKESNRLKFVVFWFIFALHTILRWRHDTLSQNCVWLRFGTSSMTKSFVLNQSMRNFRLDQKWHGRTQKPKLEHEYCWRYGRGYKQRNKSTHVKCIHVKINDKKTIFVLQIINGKLFWWHW